MTVIVIPIVIAGLEMIPEVLVRCLQGLEIEKRNGYNPNYSIVEVGQNTEKSPRGIRGLAVTQIPVKDQQLTLV